MEDIFECVIRHEVRFPIIGDNLDSKDNDNNNKRIMDPWVIHSNLWLSTTRYPLLSPSLSFESRLDFNGLYIPVCEYTVQTIIKHEACMACRTKQWFERMSDQKDCSLEFLFSLKTLNYSKEHRFRTFGKMRFCSLFFFEIPFTLPVNPPDIQLVP